MREYVYAPAPAHRGRSCSRRDCYSLDALDIEGDHLLPYDRHRVVGPQLSDSEERGGVDQVRGIRDGLMMS